MSSAGLKTLIEYRDAPFMIIGREHQNVGKNKLVRMRVTDSGVIIYYYIFLGVFLHTLTYLPRTGLHIKLNSYTKKNVLRFPILSHCTVPVTADQFSRLLL